MGTIKKRKMDYENRGDMTQEPVETDDLKLVSPLHCLMRSFSLVLSLIPHITILDQTLVNGQNHT